MASAILVIVFLFVMFLYVKQQKGQRRRIATQHDLPREQLLPRHYKSFVEVENKLWAATEERERSRWNAGTIRLRHGEAQLARNYVQGLRTDFVQANRIFSIVIGRSPTAEILMQMERHRLRIELPYYALCTVVRSRLSMDRVSLKELRLLTELVSTMAYEVRSMLGVLEREGHVEFVKTLLKES